MPAVAPTTLSIAHWTGAPAVDEPVQVLSAAGTSAVLARTDGQGLVRFPDWEDGRPYHLLIGHPPAGPIRIVADQSVEATVPVQLPAGTGAQVVFFGQVMDRRGQPAQGVGLSVEVLPPEEDPKGGKRPPNNGDGLTGTEGEESGRSGEQTLGRASLDRPGQTLGVTVTDHNGAFTLPLPPISNDWTGRIGLRAALNDEPIPMALVNRAPGPWGPHRIVVERAAPPGARQAPAPLALPTARDAAGVTRAAPHMLAQPQPAQLANSCAPRPSLDIPLRSFTLRQWAMLKPRAEAMGAGQDRREPRPALLIDFRQEWWNMGFSQGELLYSLPLAPCETVRIATVDWRRQDWAQRRSAVDESHQQDVRMTRALNVDETVSLHSDKSAKGSVTTFGGQAAIPMGPANLSGGYGKELTTASETVDATTHAARNINDAVEQHSNTVRATRAVSIVEVTQEEAVSATSRVVRNHNHCHTLTFQYYEVLHRYRVSTRMAGIVPALAVPFEVKAFDAQTLAEHGYLLRRALLDSTLEHDFDSYLNPPDPDPALQVPSADATRPTVVSPADTRQVAAFIMSGVCFYDSEKPVPMGIPGWHFYALDDAMIVYNEDPQTAQVTSATGDAGGSDELTTSTDQWKYKPKLGDVRRIGLQGRFGRFDDVRFSVRLADGVVVPLLAAPRIELTGGGRVMFDVQPVGAGQPPPPGTDVNRLLAHLNAYRWYYSGVLFSGGDAGERWQVLDSQAWLGLPLSEAVINEVAAVQGPYALFPIAPGGPLPEELAIENNSWLDQPPDERYIALPTPGVFAESALGECCACEKIDESRFWRWSQEPCPEDATPVSDSALASRARDYSAALAPTVSTLTPTEFKVPDLPDPVVTVGDETLSKLVDHIAPPDAKGLGQLLGAITQASGDYYGKILNGMTQLSGAQSGSLPAQSMPAGPSAAGAAQGASAGEVAPAVDAAGAGDAAALGATAVIV